MNLLPNFFDKTNTENIKSDNIKSKNFIPKTSTIDPEKTTGKTEAIITKNEKLPKTLPLSSGGVDSCKNV